MLVDQSPTEIKEDLNEERKTQMQPNITPKLKEADSESDFELFPIVEPKYDFISQYIKQNENDENLKVLLSNQDIQSQYSRSQKYSSEYPRTSKHHHQDQSRSSRPRNDSKMNSPSVKNPQIDVKKMGTSRRGTDHGKSNFTSSHNMSSRKHSDPKSSKMSSAIGQSLQNRLRNQKKSLEQQKTAEKERNVVARRGTQENKVSALKDMPDLKPTPQAQKQNVENLERNQGTVTTDGTLKNPQTANQSSLKNQTQIIVDA